jgi:two-component system sensor histidine kinase ChiS
MMSSGVILVVDDDPLSLKLTSFVLRSSGQRVRTATDGAEALREVRRGDVSLVLLDIQMPGP